MKKPKSIYPLKTPKTITTVKSRSRVIPYINEGGLDRVYRLDAVVAPKSLQIYWNPLYIEMLWKDGFYFWGSGYYGPNEISVDVITNESHDHIGWQYDCNEGIGILIDDLLYPAIDEFTAKVTAGIDYRPNLWRGQLSEFNFNDVRDANDS